MTITDDCSVYLEILRTKQDLEIVIEVMKISPDGHVIQVYPPQCDNTTVSDSPASPAAGSVREYSHDRLPQKYWKRYQHAAKFIDVVKSKTPKVTMYTDQAKCMLMENDNCDFEAAFYDGAKVRCCHDVTSITKCDGKYFKLDSETSSFNFDPQTKQLLEHALKIRQKCLDFVYLVTSMDDHVGSREDVTCFPAVIGRRPCTDSPKSRVSLKDPLSTRESLRSSTPIDGSSDISVTPDETLSSVEMAPNQDQTLSYASGCNSFPLPSPRMLCQVFVPGIGWGTQWSNKEVSVQFDDGSELSLKPNPMVIKYTCPKGNASSFKENDHIPLKVRQKMDVLPAVLHKLSEAQTS